MSLRERILARDDSTYQELYVDVWEETIGVVSMTVKRRAAVIKRANQDGEAQAELFNPLVVIATAVDPENREPLFGDGDLDMLMGMNVQAIDQIANFGMAISGMGDQSLLDSLGKVSSSTENGSSSSDSSPTESEEALSPS